MNNSANRVARLTSSKASLLMVVDAKGAHGFGRGAITYLNKRHKELLLGRGLELPVKTMPMRWGKMWETYVHWILGNDYKLVVHKTTIHPKFNFWSGSEDFQVTIDGGCISELKCYQMDKFMDYSECLAKQNLQLFKSSYKDEYWQIVSNSCIHNTKYGEAVAFMPTEAQVLELRKIIKETNYIEKHIKDADSYWYEMIFPECDLYDLPFIPKHSDVQGLVKFRFEVPIEDKMELTKRMINGNKYLDELFNKKQ